MKSFQVFIWGDIMIKSIGLDCDGVIRDLYSKLCEVYIKKKGKTHWCLQPDKWEKYYVADYFSIGGEIYNFWFKDCAFEIYLDAHAYSDIGHLFRLRDAGVEINIITNQPNYETALYTMHWLNKANFPYDSIHFTSRKTDVECDIYLDDGNAYIKQFVDCGKKFYIMNRAWNSDVSGPRVHSIKEFVDIIVGEKDEINNWYIG